LVLTLDGSCAGAIGPGMGAANDDEPCSFVGSKVAVTYRSLNKDAPLRRAIERVGVVISRPVLGGLHHQYCRIEYSARTGEQKRRIKRSAPRGWFAIALAWRGEELRWWQPCSWPNERHNVKAKTEIAPVVWPCPASNEKKPA
jgi:hypothetical protein